MTSRSLTIPVIAGFVFQAVAAFSAPLEAVSPGSPTGASIGDGCPTFSWGLVKGASSYELVVYSVEEGQEELPAVLEQRISGAASSWTPSLDRCIERGGRYAWSIRALGAEQAPQWSSPLLFEVASAPSQSEFDAALALVQSYLTANGQKAVETTQDAAIEYSPEPNTNVGFREPAAAGPFETKFSVDGNLQAMSFTGDGSSLSGVTTAAGLFNHAEDESAHHSRYTDAEVIAAAGPHTVDTDTTCHGQACDGANFININAATFGGQPPAAYSQGPHTTFPNTVKGDLLVRTEETVVRLPIGKNGQVLVAKSSAPAGVAWGDVVTDTLYDAFASLGSYFGSDGTVAWQHNGWMENDDDSGGANGGSIRVVEEESCASESCLRFAANSANIYVARGADLVQPNCVSAELSLDVNNQLIADTVRLEVSIDGSMTFTVLKDYDGSNSGVYSDAFDFTGAITDETEIRVRSLTSNGGFVYLDNVMVSCSALGSG